MKITLRHTLAFAAALVVLAGCTPPATTGEGGTEGARPRRQNRDLITREEMMSTGATNLYDVVHRLRPFWLTTTGGSNFGGAGQDIVVYQNEVQLGGVDALRQIAPGYAETLRWLDSSTATNTLPGLGSRKVYGAIVITTPGH